mmetsp:Transcript_51251/g.149107  ORF Transcript_51251/g.149107 Transcript_51251/m.149107 type:complete len:318 (+) Transcript_51251:72-1025(+)
MASGWPQRLASGLGFRLPLGPASALRRLVRRGSAGSSGAGLGLCLPLRLRLALDLNQGPAGGVVITVLVLCWGLLRIGVRILRVLQAAAIAPLAALARRQHYLDGMSTGVELTGHRRLDLRVNAFIHVLLAKVLSQLCEMLLQVLFPQAICVEEPDGLGRSVGAPTPQRRNQAAVKQVGISGSKQLTPTNGGGQAQMRLKFHRQSPGFGHCRILPQEGWEARERHEAVRDEGRVHTTGDCDIGQQAPILICRDLGIHDVSDREQIGRICTPVQHLRVRPFFVRLEVVLLDEQANEGEVHEEHVQSLAQGKALSLGIV